MWVFWRLASVTLVHYRHLLMWSVNLTFTQSLLSSQHFHTVLAFSAFKFPDQIPSFCFIFCHLKYVPLFQISSNDTYLLYVSTEIVSGPTLTTLITSVQEFYNMNCIRNKDLQ